MVPAEKRFECIDEQTNISSLSIELCCKKMAANYKRTAHQLDVLLEDSKGATSPTLGGKILINTGDDKRLAKAIVDEIKHYFGDPKNKPKNTADAALIIDRADDWLEGVKRSGTKMTLQEYIDLVVRKNRQKYTVDAESRTNGEFTKSLDEIIKAVEQWAEAKRKQPKTKKAKEPEPRKAINKHDHFCSTITEEQARILYTQLNEKQYIKGEVSDWMVICGVRKGTIEKRIDWVPGLNELAYFVKMLFGPTNDNKWAIAVNVFSWKGNDIKQDSIKALDNQCKIKRTKQNALDEILSIVKKKQFCNKQIKHHISNGLQMFTMVYDAQLS